MQFSEEIIARHMRPITGSAIREIFKLLGKPGMISFAGGNPSNAALEPEVISEIAREALGKYGAQLLQYGATEGFGPFLESAREFLKGAGVSAGPGELLPVQGGSQAWDLLLKAVIEPGDAILAESPTFLGALQAMRTYNAAVIPIATDDRGAIPEDVEEKIRKHRPKLLYVIPTFQNPTGVTLSLERRRALAELANRYGVVLAEDDPYRDLRFSGEPLPTIKSFDENGWVVYMSSFSKYVAPGLRLGAVVANPVLLRKMTIGKQSADVHSPLLIQAIVDGYLRKGLMPAHLERICADYRRQLGAMLNGFRYFPEGTRNTSPEGGLFVWAELPEGKNARELLETAVAKNVAYVPGTFFYVEGGHENTMRLNFSNAPVEDIEKGMRLLGEALR
ncbi:MAG: PLP-dependent aminotransferase family protein [Clostridiales bacterium]|jgi:2-aminoadipate transaminase|nr:PLP-dependent aminotransferase family protein [Clostridiales bacterium]OPZ69011.1 MAG: 2-aminoadipate transaminase [Firmicutes bacterium ADurb.Bin467]